MTFKKALKLIAPWWKSEERMLAWGGLMGLLIWCFVSIYIAVLLNSWTQDFYATIEKRDFQAFVSRTILFVPLITATLIDFCGRWFVARWLAFRWRRWYTNDLQSKWLETKSYYRIPLAGQGLDNPDQRISQDVNTVCSTTMELFQAVVRDGMNAVTFSFILWGISSGLKLPYLGFEIPGVLFWAAFLYAVLGSAFMVFIGHPIIGLDVEQEKREANFRYRLMRIHERREEIVKFLGEAAEEKTLKGAFDKIRENYYSIMKRTIYMNGFTNFFMNGNMFIPLIIAGPAYFSGALTMAILMQIRGMFYEVQFSFSLIVNNYFQIAGLVASLKRLHEFHEKIEIVRENPVSMSKGQGLCVRDLTIFTTHHHKIITLPDFSLNREDRKIMMGPSGIGKTSLFRVLRGIYPHYQGHLELPQEPLMVVPQRPYMPLGSLRDCISYPSASYAFSDQKIRDVMMQCCLEHLIHQLDDVGDYQHRLSLGEQQRINFARVFLHQPEWLLMDEPTSSLNAELAHVMIERLFKTLPTTGILIISHSKDISTQVDEVIDITPLKAA